MIAPVSSRIQLQGLPVAKSWFPMTCVPDFTVQVSLALARVSLHGLRADLDKQSVSAARHGWRQGPFHKLFRLCRLSALQLGSTSVVIL